MTHENAWCILRTASAKTLPLARSLTLAGIEVWTPIETRTFRVPRATVKRRIDIALMPTYLFARAPQLTELLALANDPTTRHAEFRVFRTPNGIPLIADDTLSPLRLSERRRKPVEQGLVLGDRVKLVDGGFAGLRGVVQESRGKFTVVQLEGFSMPLKIAACYLLREGLKADENSPIVRAA